jgi:hypothetical protein
MYTRKPVCPSFAGCEFNNTNVKRSLVELNSVGNTYNSGISNSDFAMNNFNKVFTPNAPLIEPLNFTNQNNMLHNNLAESVYVENVVEYRINIDSFDRNVKKYPNPFHFVVRFNNGDPIEDTKINFPLDNVQYVRLETIILPNAIGVECPCDRKCSCGKPHVKLLQEDRFIMLEIQELETNQRMTYSTSDNRNNGVSGAFCMIVPDSRMLRYYSGQCYNGTKMYKKNNLTRINQFTIRLYDSYGVPLIPVACKEHELPNIYLTFIIGIINPDLATKPSFPR